MAGWTVRTGASQIMDEHQGDGDLDDFTWDELKALVEFYQQYAEYLDNGLIRCEDALHDTLLRAAGVLPESAEEFYDHELAEQAVMRRKMWQLKAERGLN